MNIGVKLKNQIQNILGEGAGINLFFAIKDESGKVIIKRADLKDGETQGHLKEQFTDLLIKEFVNEEEMSVLELSEADERCNVLYHYDMISFPDSMKYFSDFDYQKCMEYPCFNFHKDALINLDAYLIVIGNQEDYCVLYKKFYPVYLLGRGSFCLIPSNSRFEEFDKDVLRISQDYQFIRIGTEIYIKDLNVLEKFGGFKDIIKKEAREAVDNIELIGILEDTKGLRELLESDLTFARKLCKVGKYSPVLSLNIPNETIIRFSNEHPGIAGQLKYSADGEHIKLNTKKSQKIFVKLLEDSYLTSELTRLYYDSIAKEMCEV